MKGGEGGGEREREREGREGGGEGGGRGGGGEGGEYYKTLLGNQVNLTVTQPKSSDPLPPCFTLRFKMTNDQSLST